MDFSVDLYQLVYKLLIQLLMQTQQADTTVDKLPEENKNQLKQTNGFKNPICEQTYRKLPMIYGRKKKLSGARLGEASPKNSHSKSLAQGKNYFSSPEQNHGKNTSMSKKSHQRLSEPKHPSQCSKKNCPCHEEEEALRKLSQKKKRNFSSTMIGRSGFPQIQKFQLQDLESKHKISMQGLTTGSNFKSGLQIIIQQQNERALNLKNKPKKEKVNKKAILNFSSAYQMHKNSLKLSKNMFKYKIKINKVKFQMLSEDDAGNCLQEKQSQPQKINKLITRYKTQEPQQVDTAKSVMLNTTMLKVNTLSKTKFSKTEIKKINQITRSPSQLSSGFFRVPEISEYQNYLRGYINMNQEFDLKALLKSPSFKVQRNQQSVYFGQLDQKENRHGYGIQVSPKEIFEGEFINDLKARGFERNIDGVYIGGYQNGERSGMGVFHWNNGQKFQGLWKNGMKNGQGVWVSPKGYKYEGEWLHNRQHGQGVFQHKNSTYKGQFKKFLKDGMGEEFFSNGDYYKGQYKQGKPDGMGRYEWKKGGFYEGEFMKGLREGKGIWVDENNVKYEGSFKADFKHGYGVETFGSGEKYEGQYVRGNRTKGKLFTKNGSAIQIKQK